MPTQELGDGKYKVLRRLAVGGMAEIFLAEAANIHGFRKKVVIKRILPQYASQQSFVEMFLDEARLAARLNHASIVQVFDIGEDAEGVFFTMEYVEGRDLAEILGECYRQGRSLELEEVLAVLMPAAEALHHAHELRDDHNRLCNLIHRDVSPSNILVTNEGQVKLLDFGVAKSNDQQRETTGVSLKGKFGYMAPEQCHGIALDRRGDIFSFGVVLWELCTGRRLYPGGNDPSVLLTIMNEDAPRPSLQRSGLPPELDRICLKALARDRDQRYGSMQEAIHDLDEFARANGIVTTSRTLSRLLENVFAECRPTEAMQAISADAVASGAQEPPALSYAGYAPTQVPGPSMAFVPDAGSSVEQSPGKSRWPWIVGLGVALTAGLVLVLMRGDDGVADVGVSASPGVEIAPGTAATTAVEASPVMDEIVDDSAAVQAATAAAQAQEAASAAEAASTDVTLPSASEDTAIDAGASTELATSDVPASKTVSAAKVRAKKARAKNGSSTVKKASDRKTRTADEKWDVNSPFAPE